MWCESFQGRATSYLPFLNWTVSWNLSYTERSESGTPNDSSSQKALSHMIAGCQCPAQFAPTETLVGHWDWMKQPWLFAVGWLGHFRSKERLSEELERRLGPQGWVQHCDQQMVWFLADLWLDYSSLGEGSFTHGGIPRTNADVMAHLAICTSRISATILTNVTLPSRLFSNQTFSLWFLDWSLLWRAS